MRPLIILVIAPAIALGMVAGAVGLVGPLPEPKRAASLVWANRVFTSRDALANWLESRGARYDLWAARHAGLARTFEPELTERTLVQSRADATSSRSRPTWSLVALLTAGLSLGGALILFRARERGRRLPARARALPRVVPHRLPRLPQPAAGLHLRAAGTNIRLAGRRLHGGVRAFAAAHPQLVDAGSVFNQQRLRRHFPTIAFYVICAISSLVLGASIAIYAR